MYILFIFWFKWIGIGTPIFESGSARNLKYLLRRNVTPPLFDVLPFEINIENYFLLIGIICTLFANFPHSSVGERLRYQSMGRAFESCTWFTFYLSCEILKIHFGGKCYIFFKKFNRSCNHFLKSCHPWKYCKVSHTFQNLIVLHLFYLH